MGKIFAVVENNPGYIPPSPVVVPKPPEEDNPEKEDESTNYNVLTFLLMIQFPFLSSYLHYYFVIPLTLVYWSLLIFGTYRIVRVIINKGKKPD